MVFRLESFNTIGVLILNKMSHDLIDFFKIYIKWIYYLRFIRRGRSAFKEKSINKCLTISFKIYFFICSRTRLYKEFNKVFNKLIVNIRFNPLIELKCLRMYLYFWLIQVFLVKRIIRIVLLMTLTNSLKYYWLKVSIIKIQIGFFSLIINF